MARDATPIVAIEPPTDESRRLWEKAIEIARELSGDEGWTLIGGLMVQLHAFEHQSDSRLTDELLERLGGSMEMPPTSNEALGYKFKVDGETVEILGPDGVGADPKTIGKYTTFQVPGGTQALDRSEQISVSIDRQPAVGVRRPSLLGAILIKARVVAQKRKEKFDSDRQDLVRLLSLVDDPRTLATEGGLKETERKWLRKVEKTIDFTDPALADLFPPENLARASQAFSLLILR